MAEPSEVTRIAIRSGIRAMKITRKLQCQSIVQPGEYVIDRWDGKRCEESNPRLLMHCEGCGGTFCYMHWSIHVYSVPNNHFVGES